MSTPTTLSLKKIYSGKVRDLYEIDDKRMLMVATDRLSAFDVILEQPIPEKGKILTAISNFWFDKLAGVVPNHFTGDKVEDVVPAAELPLVEGRAIDAKRLEPVAADAIVRGYIVGSGWKEYQKSGTVCGIALPEGLVDGSRLPEPIYTPTSKADVGDHDLPMTYEETAGVLGADLAARVRDLTLEIYRRGAEIALDKGIIIADTKLEFGIDAGGTLRLADEVLTSDSSRFWDAAAWKPGQTQPSFDKQFVRDWARSTGWKPDDAEAPEIPQDIVDATLSRYTEAYELLTGRRW